MSIFLALALPAAGLAQSFALGPKISTLGPGLEATFRVSERVNLRAAAHVFSMTRDIEETDIAFEGDIDMTTGALLLDFHPGAGSFRLTAGGVAGDSEFTGRSTEDTVIVVGGVPYNVAQVGRIDATVTPGSAGPYAGIGFGNPFARQRGWSASLDLGAWFWGDPEAELIAVPNPGVTLPPGYEQSLAAEEAELQEEVESYTIMPVVSFSVRYTF